jgi:uncharacterized protein (TIGR03382 family)
VEVFDTYAQDGGVSGGQAVRTSFQKDFLIAGAQAAATMGAYPLPVWAGDVVPDADVPDPDSGAATINESPAKNDSGCSASPRSKHGSASALALLVASIASLVARRRRQGV